VGTVRRGFVAQGDAYTASTFQFEARYPEAELYAQDTWKVKKNLTVDLDFVGRRVFRPPIPQSRMLIPNQPRS